MAMVISSPTTGSAQSQPSATPPAPSSTASEVSPSARHERDGDERRRADLAAGPDAIAGGQLLPVNPISAARPRQSDPPGVQQAADRLVRRQRGRRGDDEHDRDSGQVLGAPVSVGVPAGGRPPSDDERDPSGSAVRASAALCRVSPSSATEPDAAVTAAWISAVTPSTPSEIHSVRMPSRLDSMAASTWSAASWECGRSRWRRRRSSPGPDLRACSWPCPSPCSCPCSCPWLPAAGCVWFIAPRMPGASHGC